MLILPDSADPIAPPLPLLRAGQVARPRRDVERGALVAVRRGIYAPAQHWRELAPWDRYLARVFAVAMQHPDAVFCFESAAALSGLPILGDPLVVHVLAHAGETARLDGGIRTHTANSPRELTEDGGHLRTAPRETAVDIARSRHPAYALAVADAVLRGDSALAVESLVVTNETRASSRGRRVARWPLHRADAAAESTFESVSRAAIEWLGFPQPLLQHWFVSRDGSRDRGDFAWPEDGVIGEADGDVKYDGSYGTPLARLRDRRARDARLMQQVRAVAHWAWDDVAEPARLRRILESSGLRRTSPEQTAPLFSLRRIL